jgi:hypothetical protein
MELAISQGEADPHIVQQALDDITEELQTLLKPVR